MSEVTNNEAPEAVVEAASVVSQAPAEVNAPAGTESKTDVPNYEYVPAKFRKEDGSPDFEKLAKSYTGLEKKLSTKANIPALSADEYEYDFGDLQVDQDKNAEFKTQALEKGLTTEQYKFVMDTHLKMIQGMAGAQAFKTEQTETALKEAWGKDYMANAQAAKVGFEEFAPSDANIDDPVWNHPAVMKLLARIGSEVGEDSLSGSNKPVVGTSIDAQIAELRAKPNSFNDAAIQAQLTALYERKYK